MAQLEVVNTGALPNDGEGDPLRVAFQKINNNFANLWLTGFQTSNTYSIGNSPGQVIFSTPVSTFTQGLFQIKTFNPDTNDSEQISLSAQIYNNGSGVAYSGWGTTVVNTWLTTYKMDVDSGNVRILVDPLVDEVLLHFISSQVTFIGVGTPGLLLELDGYVAGSVMSTEDSIDLTTED